MDTTINIGFVVTQSGQCQICKLTKRPCWTWQGKRICASCAANACTSRAGDAVSFGGMPSNAKSRLAAGTRKAA